MAKHHRTRNGVEGSGSLGAAAMRTGSAAAAGSGRGGASDANGTSGTKASGSGSGARSTSPAARSRARKQAIQPARRSLRERPGMLLAIGVVVVAVALGGLALVLWRQPGTSSPSSNVAGITDWQADPPGLQDRLASAGLPALTAEGEALHIHQHLDLYVNGEHVPVPADIGIDQNAGILSPLHTHDDTGIIHVESPTVQEFTLAQFFKVWGVDLSPVSIGGYKVDATHQLQMWVNGQVYSGDPGSLALGAHQEIVIAYGTAGQMPNPVPATYAWPTGY